MCIIDFSKVSSWWPPWLNVKLFKMLFTKGAADEQKVHGIIWIKSWSYLNSDWCDYINPVLFNIRTIHGSSHLPYISNVKIPHQWSRDVQLCQQRTGTQQRNSKTQISAPVLAHATTKQPPQYPVRSVPVLPTWPSCTLIIPSAK